MDGYVQICLCLFGNKHPALQILAFAVQQVHFTGISQVIVTMSHHNYRDRGLVQEALQLLGDG
jgi:predicted acetyltransferase